MFKILIVEDDRFISTILAFFLKNLGHQSIERCRSGEEALEVCKNNRPEVVLMDIHLEGDMDGISTAEKIQREFEIPVIYISGDTSSEIVERAIITNSYGYLVKPIQKRELGITIDLAYYKHKVDMERKRREQAFRQFISGAAIPIVIVSDGRIRYLNINALHLFHSHYIEDIMGLPFIDFTSDSEKETIKNILSQPPNSGSSIGLIKSSIIGAHGKEIDVAICGSWIKFNDTDALQLVLFDIADEKKALSELNLFKKILKEGMAPYVEMNSFFEITDYNDAFQSIISPAIEMKGSSLFNLKPFINIEDGVMADHVKNKEISNFDLDMNTSYLNLKCRAYIFRNKEFETDKIIISILETIYKE